MKESCGWQVAVRAVLPWLMEAKRAWVVNRFDGELCGDPSGREGGVHVRVHVGGEKQVFHPTSLAWKGE